MRGLRPLPPDGRQAKTKRPPQHASLPTPAVRSFADRTASRSELVLAASQFGGDLIQNGFKLQLSSRVFLISLERFQR